jgi:GNAT superfamily N-acetyltransferase
VGDKLKLVALTPSTPMDFETMRQIRNQCRDFMTRNTDEITPERQKQFALELQEPDCKTFAYLYLLPPAGWAGYGIRRWDADQRHWWLTGALVAKARGQGYGRQLFEHLVSASLPEPSALEVRITNLPARRLYESMGFVERARRQDIITMLRQPQP